MNKLPTDFFEKERPTMEEYLEDIQLKYDTLNKGIDELIEKYTKEINKCDCDTCRVCQTYHKVIDDLKSLKGE